MRLKRCSAAVLLILAAGAVSPGLALGAPMTETFDFSASIGGAAPYPTVSGSATVTFDVAVDQDVTPVNAFSSNLPASYGPFSFTYEAALNTMLIGDDCTGLGSCATDSGADTASLGFELDAAGVPTGGISVVYGSVSDAANLFEGSGTVTAETAIPEPASLALLGMLSAGFGLIRTVRRG